MRIVCIFCFKMYRNVYKCTSYLAFVQIVIMIAKYLHLFHKPPAFYFYDTIRNIYFNTDLLLKFSFVTHQIMLTQFWLPINVKVLMLKYFVNYWLDWLSIGFSKMIIIIQLFNLITERIACILCIHLGACRFFTHPTAFNAPQKHLK